MTRTDTSAEQRFREQTRPERPFALFRWAITFAIVTAFLLSGATIDAQWDRLLNIPERGWNFLTLLIRDASLDPLVIAFEAMWESVAIAWVATLIGVIISFPLIFLAAFNIANRGVVLVTRQILNLFRAIPEIVLAIAFIPFFGLNPVTAAVAMGISSIGTLGKLSAEIVEAIDKGPLEAVEAAGGGWLAKLRWGVLPQAMPEIAAFWLYRFEINIRVSAILGVLGIGGIGTFIAQAAERNYYDRIGLGLLVVVVVTMAIDGVSSRVRRRIIEGPSVELDIKREQAARAEIAGEQS